MKANIKLRLSKKKMYLLTIIIERQNRKSVQKQLREVAGNESQVRPETEMQNFKKRMSDNSDFQPFLSNKTRGRSRFYL